MTIRSNPSSKNRQNVTKAKERSPENTKGNKKSSHVSVPKICYYYAVAAIVLGIAATPWSFLFSSSSSKNDDTTINNTINNNKNDTIEFLSSFICKHKKGYCHPSMKPVLHRTHVVTSAIPPTTELLILPRDRIILDLDALRDPWIQTHLFPQQSNNSFSSLDSGAFLAAYLARRIQQQQQQGTSHDPMAPYFSMLPSYETLAFRHPPLWSQELQIRLLNQSSALQISIAIRTMIEREYSTFSARSSDFATHILKQDYTTARINVMARSFGTGPVYNVVSKVKGNTIPQELQYYQQHLGIDLRLGCRALSPILDMWDHHPKAPTQWEYSYEKQAFVVQTKPNEIIPTGFDVWVTYGNYTDSHLFAKFGFVNADGSGWTEATIASFHNVGNVGGLEGGGLTSKSLVAQKEEDQQALQSIMGKYLQYYSDDDAIPNIIAPLEINGVQSSISSATRLEQCKLQILVRIRNDYKRWNFQMQPRDILARPGKSSKTVQLHTIPTFYNNKRGTSNVKFDGSHIIATCRLIVLTEQDYDGRSLEILERFLWKQEHTHADVPLDFVAQAQGDHLEYRALECLYRLVTRKLSHYPTTILEDVDKLTQKSNQQQQQTPLDTREQWSLLVNLGEKQSLEVLSKIALDGMNKKRKLYEIEENKRRTQEKHNR